MLLINKKMTNNKLAYLTLTAVIILLFSLSSCKKDNNSKKITIVPIDTVKTVKPIYALI